MRNFFLGVRKRIGKLDAEQLREQYRLIADEADFLDTLFLANSEGIIVLGEHGEVVKSNPAARYLLGMEPSDALPALNIQRLVAQKRLVQRQHQHTALERAPHSGKT